MTQISDHLGYPRIYVAVPGAKTKYNCGAVYRVLRAGDGPQPLGYGSSTRRMTAARVAASPYDLHGVFHSEAELIEAGYQLVDNDSEVIAQRLNAILRRSSVCALLPPTWQASEGYYDQNQ